MRRRALLIVVTTCLALLAGWAAAPTSSVYSAEATIYVGARQLAVTPGGALSNDAIAALERITQTFATMIDSEPVAQSALEITGVQRSAAGVVGATTVEPVRGTQLLVVKVTDDDPDVAHRLANGMSDAFVENVQNFEPSAPAQEGSLPALPAYVFERAQLPTSPVPSGALRTIVLSGLFGFVIALGVALMLEYLDLTVKSAADAERRLELPVLGVIPMQRQTAAPGRA